MKLNVIFVLIGLLSPELNDFLLSRLVTVCGACVAFFQATVVPTLIVSVLGLNTKLPLPSVVIITVTVLPETVVAAGVVLFVEVLAVAVGDGDEAWVVGLPPQAAKSTSIANIMRQNTAVDLAESIFLL